MNESPPRLRMFAGPNGSGKTTVKNAMEKLPSWFGIYLNPDEIELELRAPRQFKIGDLGLPVAAASLQRHFSSSEFLRSRCPGFDAATLFVENDAIHFPTIQIDSYVASVLADYLRRTAMNAGKSFSFETVMSSPDKVELLAEARSLGYRTYLYYIATEDPWINVSRVEVRVAEGGHNVPTDKVIDRYRRSIGLLLRAIQHSNRGFMFDTSREEPWYFAETTDGQTIELKGDSIPNWFAPIWHAFDQPAV